MVAEHKNMIVELKSSCSLAKISMVAELCYIVILMFFRCSLAKISMVAERGMALVAEH